MYDLFLKLAREELSSTKLTQLDQVKLREYKSFIDSTLNSLIKNVEAFDYFKSIVTNVLKDLDLWVRFRLVKYILNPKSMDEVYDNLFISIIEKLIELYKWFFSGLSISYRDLMFVKVNDNVVIHGRVLRKNDYVFLNVKDYVELFINNKITPIPRLVIHSTKLL